MQNVSNIGRYLLITVLVLNLFSVSMAASTIQSALQDLCEISQTFLAATIMVLIVLAGAIYAAGQILGAETRARASVWATAMLTGAIIGALIYIVTPILLRSLLSGTGASLATAEDPCVFN